MLSGMPRPQTTGSASWAPAPASLRISAIGLISLPSGMKPETIVRGVSATGNGRAASARAAAARALAGNASRRPRASTRSSALACSIAVD